MGEFTVGLVAGIVGWIIGTMYFSVLRDNGVFDRKRDKAPERIEGARVPRTSDDPPKMRTVRVFHGTDPNNGLAGYWKNVEVPHQQGNS